VRLGGGFFKSYIQSNFRILLVSLLSFACGTLAGSIFCLRLSPEASTALKNAISGMQALLDADRLTLFSSSAAFYLQTWFFLWMCGTGSLGIVFAPFFVAVRGFACGYAVTALISFFGMRGLAAAAVGVLAQMLWLLPVLQVLCVLAMRHVQTSSAVQDRARRRSLFIAYTLSCLATLPLFALAALYDSYLAWRLILKLLP